jgi:hypothetical protein
LETVFSLISLL